MNDDADDDDDRFWGSAGAVCGSVWRFSAKRSIEGVRWHCGSFSFVFLALAYLAHILTYVTNCGSGGFHSKSNSIIDIKKTITKLKEIHIKHTQINLKKNEKTFNN